MGEVEKEKRKDTEDVKIYRRKKIRMIKKIKKKIKK